MRPAVPMKVYRQPGPATACAGCHAVMKQKVSLFVGVLSQPDPNVRAMEDCSLTWSWLWNV